MELLDKLTINDLDETQREVAEVIGIEAYRNLVSWFGGSSIYVCKKNSILKEIRDREIRGGFNGDNYMELARLHDLSERQVRLIISEATYVPDGQISFDELIY